MSLTIITCTGGRQLAFALCERWMARQTYRGSLQWIVADDCDPPTRVTMDQTVIRPEPRWTGAPTLGRNLRAALDSVIYSKIVFAEDDDFYPSDYLERMCAALEVFPIVGEAPARYYNVAARKYRVLNNMEHASLSQTGVRRSMLSDLAAICEREQQFIDLPLWLKFGRYGKLIPSTVIGIKGLPGRAGIGMGHLARKSWPNDTDGSVLRSWIGADASAYEPQYAEVA